MSGEMPREPGIYLATCKQSGVRMMLDVDFATLKQDRLKARPMWGSVARPLSAFTDYAKAIDPLAKEPQ